MKSRKNKIQRVFIVGIASVLIYVMVFGTIAPMFMGMQAATPIDKATEDAISFFNDPGVQVKEGIKINENGSVDFRTEDFPEDSAPASTFLESMQPKFDFSLAGWFMGLEDKALEHSRSDMDRFVVTMMDIFYGELNNAYTVEELEKMPEVLELEDYLWERLGVTEYIEDIRSRLPEILETINEDAEGRELRVESNIDLLMLHVHDLRGDFYNSKHKELLNEVMLRANLSDEDMIDLTGVIVEVAMYHKSQNENDHEGGFNDILSREQVLKTTAEGLWNSKSPMTFMTMDTEFQPLLSLLVEIVVGQMEQMDLPQVPKQAYTPNTESLGNEN